MIFLCSEKKKNGQLHITLKKLIFWTQFEQTNSWKHNNHLTYSLNFVKLVYYLNYITWWYTAALWKKLYTVCHLWIMINAAQLPRLKTRQSCFSGTTKDQNRTFTVPGPQFEQANSWQEVSQSWRIIFYSVYLFLDLLHCEKIYTVLCHLWIMINAAQLPRLKTRQSCSLNLS